MAVEIDADARPFQARCDLLDMGRFARAVIARHHNTAVFGKACQNCQGCLAVKEIIGVKVRDMGVCYRVGRNHHIAIDTEHFTCRHHNVGHGGNRMGGSHSRTSHHILGGLAPPLHNLNRSSGKNG